MSALKLQVVHDTRTDIGPLMERELLTTLYPEVLGVGPYMTVRLPRDKTVFDKLVVTAEGERIQGYVLDKGVLRSEGNTGIVIGRKVLLCGTAALPLAEYNNGVDFAIRTVDFEALDGALRTADLGKQVVFPTKCDWAPMEMLVKTPAIQTVRDDVDFFLSHQDWYTKRGFPFRLSFLLYGAPGNGKSCCIRALAEGLKAPIKTFRLGDPKMTDGEFEEWFFGQDEAFEIKVLEDLDRYFTPGVQEGSSRTGVTLPCILNCLDGVRRVENMILFGTANHPEWFDAQVLIRPGRFNQRVEFQSPSEEAIVQYFLKFAGPEDVFPTPQLKDLAAQIAQGQHSYAMLFTIFMTAASRVFAEKRSSVTINDLYASFEQSTNTKMGAKMSASGKAKTGFLS